MAIINFDVLKDKNALLIFVSQLVSAICDKMMSIGLIWYLTKSFGINVVPWYLTVSFLPHLLMAFYSTSVINRVGTLKTIIGSEFFRGLVLIVLFFSIGIFDLQGSALLTSLFVMAFLVGLGSSLFNPAMLSIPPRLVNEEKVVALNALIDTSMSVSTILGASIAILLLNIMSLENLILVNALSFIFAGFMQLGVKEINKSSNGQDVNDQGDNHVLIVLNKYPSVARILISFLFLNLVFTPLLVMIPWYVEKIYLGDSSSLAIIEGAMGAGALIAGLIVSLTSFQVSDKKRISLISVVSFLFGALFLIFAFSMSTWHGALILLAVGFLTTFLNVQILTYFQTGLLKAEEVPAIMTAVNIISAATVPLSLSFSGLIFPHVYIPNFAKVSGVIIVFMSLFLPMFLQGSLWKPQPK